MNCLVDAQLPPALCRWLRARGHEARHVTDMLPSDATDTGIADLVERDGLVLVSKDEDFLIHRLPDRFVLLWLRCGNASNRALTIWLEARWTEVDRLLREGERIIELR